jgi:hypothetical protein
MGNLEKGKDRWQFIIIVIPVLQQILLVAQAIIVLPVVPLMKNYYYYVWGMGIQLVLVVLPMNDSQQQYRISNYNNNVCW